MILPAVFGLFIIAIILLEAFETIILPRRVARWFRLTRAFYISLWIPTRAPCAHLIRSTKTARNVSQFLRAPFTAGSVRALGRAADHWIRLSVLRQYSARSHATVA